MSIKRYGAVIAIAIGVVLAPSQGIGQEYQTGGIRILDPRLRAPRPGDASTGLFMVIENDGDQPDRLVGGTTAVADAVEIRNRSASLLVLPFSTVKLVPDGVHVMLHGLRERRLFKAGDRIAVTLGFERAGPLTVDALVEPAD